MDNTLGFVPGTDVHTPTGRVRIDALGVGDWIFSKSLGNGVVTPSQVREILITPKQEIHCLELTPSSEYFKAAEGHRMHDINATFFVVAAVSQPIRLVPMSAALMKCRGTPQACCMPESGWASVDQVFAQAGHCVELIDGTVGVVSSRSIVYRTTTQDVGWVINEFTRDLDLDYGHRLDLRGAFPQFEPDRDYNKGVAWWEDGTGIEHKVISLAIESGNGYFVGREGVYVASNGQR